MDVDPAQADPLRVAETSAAMRKGAHVITNAALRGEIDGVDVLAEVDVLVRVGEPGEPVRYLPVIISDHRVARPHATATMQMVAVNRLGLSAPLEVGAKARHHTLDGYRLALAELLLRAEGLATGRGGVIGQDRSRVYFADTTRYVPCLLYTSDAADE